RLIGGFVTAVLHDRVRRAEQLASVTRQADWLASAGADLLVLAAATGGTGYSGAADTTDVAGRVLFESLDRCWYGAYRRRAEPRGGSPTSSSICTPPGTAVGTCSSRTSCWTTSPRRVRRNGSRGAQRTRGSMGSFEVITMGRIGVDLYPEQIGATLAEVRTF